MISNAKLTAAVSAAPQIALPAVAASRPRAESRSETRESAAAVLPSVQDTRRAARDQKKAMAYQQMQAVWQRMQTLGMMLKLDGRAALKMAAGLARELKAAVDAYKDAGGRNVSQGDLAMIRREAEQARDAQAKQTEAAPAVPAASEAERAGRQAYAAAASAMIDDRLSTLAARETDMVADKGFFDQVKIIVGDLRKAREKLRGEAHLSLNPPSDDEWKDADKAQQELERAVDGAV